MNPPTSVGNVKSIEVPSYDNQARNEVEKEIIINPVKSPSVMVSFTFDKTNLRFGFIESEIYGSGFKVPSRSDFPQAGLFKMSHGETRGENVQIRGNVNTVAFKDGYFLMSIDLVPPIIPDVHPETTINRLPCDIGVKCTNRTCNCAKHICTGGHYYSGLPFKSHPHNGLKDLNFYYNPHGDDPTDDIKLRWALLPSGNGYDYVNVNYVIVFPGRKFPPGSRNSAKE